LNERSISTSCIRDTYGVANNSYTCWRILPHS
jgi:hypothetical protein